MRKADGVGLAAVQIGVLRRCFVIEYEEKKYEFVNPQIVSQEGEDTAKEGCLSIDHKKDGLVTRPLKLTIKYQTRTGEKKQDSFEGWVARIICHENDHLDGVLFIDKVIETPKN
jgi:peptide deformylase